MIETERLILRPWKDEDKEPFARMNANPEVMRYFSGTMSRAESDAAVARYINHQSDHGYCFWAVEEKAEGAFIGFVGLNNPNDLPLDNCVEIGWRLDPKYWGKGYATEGAHASLRFGFDEKGLDEILSITTHNNKPSRAVMERLGMTWDPNEDFPDPELDADHPLSLLVLYRLKREDYSK